MKEFDVIVIGSGASGMIAAIEAKKRGNDVCILERLSKVGKKILATGNGKCNLSNLSLKENDYRSEVPTFPYDVLKSHKVKDTLQYFEQLGILWFDKDGYVYPRSEQATSIVNALELKLQALSVPIFCEQEVENISYKKGKFHIVCTTKEKFIASECILATGGKAQEKLGSNGSGYELAKSFGHSIVPVIPALTALHTTFSGIKSWGGIRATCGVTIYSDGKKIAMEKGEVQFTNYGISGIPVFQISRYATHSLYRKKRVEVELDFYQEGTKRELEQLICSLCNQCSYKNIRELLEGIFSKKLVPIFLQQSKIKDTLRCKEIKKHHIQAIVEIVKQLRIVICNSNDFSQAQICAGGVSVAEINYKTMESKLQKGLYLVGELVDVDGTCGGYNLQWAWTSGYVAGNSVKGKEKQ